MSISFGAAGAVAYGTGSISAAYPTGITAGQLLIYKIGVRPGDTVTATLPPGGAWFQVGLSVGTFGTTGLDAGPTRAIVFAKYADGTESGTSQSVTITSGNAAFGWIERYTKAAGTEFSVEGYAGQDSSSGTGYSAACTAYAGAVTAGDLITGLLVKPTDAGGTTAYSAISLSATGLTFGSTTEIVEASTANGNDMGGVGFYVPVSSGTMSGSTITAAATLSNASYGPAALVRIREVTPATTIPALVGTPQSAARGTAGTLSITPQASAKFWVAVAFGDFTTPANAPAAANWKLVGMTSSRAVWTSNFQPGSTWTIATGLASIIVWGYDREVALDFNINDNSVVSPTLYAEKGGLVTRWVSGVTAGVPGTNYPAGHTATHTSQLDLGGAYLFNAISSIADSDGGSVGAETYTFGTTVLGSGSSVPNPQTQTLIAYTSNPAFTGVSAGSGIVWQDEFNTGTLDTAKWVPSYTSPGKFNSVEEQAYTPRTSNIELTGTELRLHLRRESFSADGITAPWTSGRITTRDTFRYGEYRARIQVPAGQGVWPAFWTLGDERVGIGGWPAIGEIDIMETRGPATVLTTAAHGFDPGAAGLPFEWAYSGEYSGTNLSTQFMEYWVVWTPTGITYGVDSTTLATLTKASVISAGRLWPFDNPQHIILNVATGGLGGGPTDGTTPNDNVMRVDWVRISDAEVYPASTASELTRTATGGVTLGGSATHTINLERTASGGITLGGSAPRTIRVVRTAAGGVVLDGSATHTVRLAATASGGITIDGSATRTVRIVATATGGVTLGGSTVHGISLVRTATGGIVLGGSAERTVRHARLASGGIILGGSAVHEIRIVRTATGGVTLGGVGNVISDEQSRTASGGITIGGTADINIHLTTTASGGMTLGGSASHVIRVVRTASGGVVLGGIGQTSESESQSRTALGVITLGGSVTHEIHLRDSRTASGGIALSGSATHSMYLREGRTASGGIVLGGSAQVGAPVVTPMTRSISQEGGIRSISILKSNRSISLVSRR